MIVPPVITIDLVASTANVSLPRAPLLAELSAPPAALNPSSDAVTLTTPSETVMVPPSMPS